MRLLLVFVFTLLFTSINAQSSFWFGPKGGPTMAFQKWNNFDQRVLPTWHLAAFIETYADDDADGSLFAQLGYHTRGSAIRFINAFSFNTNVQGFKFNNASLMVGAKRFLPARTKSRPYYFVGLRLEYTVKTNLNNFEEQNNNLNSVYYPFDQAVNKWNYGLSAGGGYKFKLTDLIGAFVDFTISPDVSYQYQQPGIPNVVGPSGNAITLSERQIRNLSFEISFGINLLRKVIYVD